MVDPLGLGDLPDIRVPSRFQHPLPAECTGDGLDQRAGCVGCPRRYARDFKRESQLALAALADRKAM
ncbi:hypothetical protein LJ725_10525 [Reyranella aquatilis]|uniref:DUF1289 domain-containing protein n=1 Tax=Reyranella aquatilis TaxID=2035356 RepID=A0ABS8KTJ9_9HYPH|nr:hypothetical protein [Reyranella aquatilis]